MRAPCRCIVVVCLTYAFALAGDQTAARGRLRSTSELVLINATVLDRQDRFVSDLRPEQLELFDEGVPQRIASFAVEDVPVSLAIICDVSGSMKHELPNIKAGLIRLAETAKPGDEYLLITTSSQPLVRVPWTSDAGDVERAIGAEQASGPTALVDAIVLAVREAKRGRNTRKAILVLSDGLDNHSRYSVRELERIIQETTTPIYSFTRDTEAFPWIARLVLETGGRNVRFYSGPDLPRKVARLDVHKQYVIGFVPAGAKAGGKYRRTKLKLHDSLGKLRVYWRRGYFAVD